MDQKLARAILNAALLLLAATLAFAPTLMGRLYLDAFTRLPAVFGH